MYCEVTYRQALTGIWRQRVLMFFPGTNINQAWWFFAYNVADLDRSQQVHIRRVTG
jgi:hypothetical protein